MHDNKSQRLKLRPINPVHPHAPVQTIAQTEVRTPQVGYTVDVHSRVRESTKTRQPQTKRNTQTE